LREKPGSGGRVNNVRETNIGKAPVAARQKFPGRVRWAKATSGNSVAPKKQETREGGRVVEKEENKARVRYPHRSWVVTIRS